MLPVNNPDRPCHHHELVDDLFRTFAPRLMRCIALGLALLLAGGCAVLPAQPEERGLTGEARLEKLLADRQYQKALQFLPELATELDSAAYKAKQRQLLALIDKLETETVDRANDFSARNEPAAALKVLDEALKKIPASTKLLDLRKNLRDEIDHRRNLAKWNLLISRVVYLNAQLQGYRELARLKGPSWLNEWRLAAIGDAIADLSPDLLECGRQALSAAENKVADRCLQLAGEIEGPKSVDRMPAQARGIEKGPESEPDLTSIMEPLAEIKKFKPASAQPGPSPEELEDRLREEIARQDLRQGYATLGDLEKIPAAAGQYGKYKSQLDQIRERQIAEYLDDAAAHYRGGRIAQAREYWVRVLELDPDNKTALDKIARADRVLKKLHDLQESQGKTIPPP